jgi:hypothetical protein
MLNYSFELMTNGNNLDFVHSSLKKKFGYDSSIQFLNEYGYKLKKCYGQLGYLFIDSNIYSNCDEMSNSFSKLQHVGSKLIYSLKSNSKCVDCNLHKEGCCGKVGLLVSNNPIVRSSRAVKRVLKEASTFVPKNYINECTSKIKSEESNLELISSFALGIKEALDNEKKNIGKTASKDRSIIIEIQESFISPISYDIDLFKQSNDSRIINEIL